MRRLATFVAILVLLTTAVAPVLACVTGDLMSREESTCCRAMHGQCGEMVKMGCCRSEVRTDEAPQIAAISPVMDVQWVVVAKLEPASAAGRSIVAPLLEVPEDHSPPGLLTASITVLRI